MKNPLLLVLLLSGCDLDSLQWASEGFLTLGDGIDCPIDEPTSVGYGFCLDGPTAFAVSGDGDCGSVTVWMDPLLVLTEDESTFSLNDRSTDLGRSEASVWITAGGESYASSSGTATLLKRTDGNVAVSFDAQMQVFVGGDPGPPASGMVICEPSGS